MPSVPTYTPDFNAIFAFFQKGGIFMIPLLICSVVGLAAVAFKALALSRSRIAPPSLEAALLKETSLDTNTLVQLERGRSSLARLAAVAWRHRERPHAEIVSAVESSAREESVHLHAGIGVIDVVITVAPLLGLLGTASGLVSIFQGIGDTTEHLAIARGIAEALSTTITGLAIAVPSVIAHSYFTRRIERLSARLELILGEFTRRCAASAS